MVSDWPLSAARADRERFWRRATLLFLVLTSLLRLCLLPRLELAADEAYYWDWSRHLALGYYDQGPLIAYLIRLTTTLFGNTEFGVRFGVWAVCVGTLVCAYALTRRYASAFAGFLTVLFLALTPLVTAGSFVATYDPPLVFFWALALLALERALFSAEPIVQNRAWMLAGLATGLGLLSKHTMLLIVPCLILFLFLSPAHRRWLQRPQPYLAFLLTLSMYTGVLWWNSQHHWWTFGHLLFLAGKNSGTPLSRFGDLIGGQAVLLGPGLFLGCLWACCRRARSVESSSPPAPNSGGASPIYSDPGGQSGLGSLERSPSTVSSAASGEAEDTAFSTHSGPGERGRWRREIHLFLCCFGLPVFGFFCLMIFKAKVQANWAPCTWITPIVALAMALAERIEQPGRDSRRAVLQVWAITATSGALTLLLLCPWLRLKVGIRQDAEADISNRTYGARQMAKEVDAIRTEMLREGQPVFLAANDYQTCALLDFYLPDHSPTYDLFLGYRLNNYAVDADRLQQHLGENALYVSMSKGEDEPLHELFERVEWSEPYPVWRQPYFARPIRSHYYARCYRFRRYIGITCAKGG